MPIPMGNRNLEMVDFNMAILDYREIKPEMYHPKIPQWGSCNQRVMGLQVESSPSKSIKGNFPRNRSNKELHRRLQQKKEIIAKRLRNSEFGDGIKGVNFFVGYQRLYPPKIIILDIFCCERLKKCPFMGIGSLFSYI